MKINTFTKSSLAALKQSEKGYQYSRNIIDEVTIRLLFFCTTVSLNSKIWMCNIDVTSAFNYVNYVIDNKQLYSVMEKWKAMSDGMCVKSTGPVLV